MGVGSEALLENFVQWICHPLCAGPNSVCVTSFIRCISFRIIFNVPLCFHYAKKQFYLNHSSIILLNYATRQWLVIVRCSVIYFTCFTLLHFKLVHRQWRRAYWARPGLGPTCETVRSGPDPTRPEAGTTLFVIVKCPFCGPANFPLLSN